MLTELDETSISIILYLTLGANLSISNCDSETSLWSQLSTQNSRTGTICKCEDWRQLIEWSLSLAFLQRLYESIEILATLPKLHVVHCADVQALEMWLRAKSI